jgi:hypothetical protein
MSFDKIFSMMYRLNENRFGPGKGKVVAGDSKLVAVPIDRDSLKVKLVGDMQDYIVSGRLTKPGFDGIINWLNQQPDIADYYYKLKDLKTYFIVYEILQDREDALIGKDKQVFKFTIAERKAVPALNPAVSHVTQEEVELIRSGGGAADLTIPVGTKALDGGTSGTSGVVGNTAGTLSVEQIKAKGGPSAVTEIGIKDNVDPKVIGLLTTAYNLIKGDATAGSHPGMPKVKAELQADKLGAFSQAFVYALNSGFGILDAKFQETPDTGINTSLISKILTTPKPVKVNDSRGYFLHPNGYSLIKEEASAIIGFDADAFVASFTLKLEAMKTKTGDIVVPPEGFKFQNPVTTKDPELAKFQTILKTNLPLWKGGGAKNVQVVKDFMKATADGGYGTRTQALVFWLKDGLSVPKYADSDKNTILPDFVNRMLKEFNLIKESKSYRGLNSQWLISEDFDFEAAADSGGGSTVVTPKKVVPKKDKDGNPIVAAKKDGTSSSGKSGEYVVFGFEKQVFKNEAGQAYVKKEGESTWKLVTDTKAIKQIVNSPANVAIVANKDSAWYWLNAYPTYRFAKITGGSGWEVSLDKGKTFGEMVANDTNQPYITALNATYGASGAVTATAMPIATIRANHKTFGTYLASFWAAGSQVLKDYHGDVYSGWDDKEWEAWEFIKRQVNANKTKGIPLLDSTLKGIKLLPEGPDKVESIKNDAYLRKQLTSAEGNCGLFGKHMGKCGNDIYKLRLEQGGAQTLAIDIQTDY